MPHRTLLDLDRIPTLDELRAFFKENDWSAASYMDIDHDKTPNDTIEALEHMKSMLDEHWEPLSREMGLKSDSRYYGAENPLIALRDNFENLVSTGVLKLIEEEPEKAEEILAGFMDGNGGFDGDADRLLHTAVETAIKTMSYEETAKVIRRTPAYEDFNHRKKNNYRAADFDRQWNHTRTKMNAVSMTDLESEDNARKGIPNPCMDTAEEAIANVTQKTFWASISEDDKKLLRLRMEGRTHQEIADAFGYKTHSAVTKRLLKLKNLFESCA
jgi:hypothetical protein